MSAGDLTKNQTARVVAHLQRAYGITPHEPLLILAGGADNLNVRVRADSGDYVLRRYDLVGRTRAKRELDLVRVLVAKLFPTPLPIKTASGSFLSNLDGRPAALFPFVPGKVPLKYSVALAKQMGAQLATLHLATIAMRTSLRGWSDLADIKLAQRRMGDLKIDGVRHYANAISENLNAHRQSQCRLPAGIIHHDFHRGNILCNSHGRIVSVLDFGEACTGPFILDIARSLSYMCLDGPDFLLTPTLRRALLSGYERKRRLLPEESDALPLMFALANLADAARYLRDHEWSIRSIKECHSWRVFDANRWA